jgi:amino acid adenylation domain-containing protein
MEKKGWIEFDREELHQTIPARFEKIVAEYPDRLAVLHNTLTLTYGQLNQFANRVANALIQSFSQDPELVLLLLDEPVHHAVAQLGVLKAGMTCVPVDTTFPAARQAQIIEDSGSRTIVTEAKYLRHADLLLQGKGRVLPIDALSNASADDPAFPRKPTDLAYVLFTSGSTGRPKGVMQTHRNLLHLAMLYHRDLGVSYKDRFAIPTSPAYTGTIWAMLGAFTNGAAFLFTDFDSPQTLLQFLNRERVTVAQLIVTLFRQFLLGFDDPVEVPSLRLIYTGGEALQKTDVKKFSRIFPVGCSLLYNFGSTEAGMVTHARIERENIRQEAELPVGLSVKDTDVMLADENGQPVAGHEEGEIVVSSDFLSPGYWKDEERTRKRFKPGGKYGRIYYTGDFGRINGSGHLIHLGRKDNQVKIRGYRIQLQEIEEALRSIEGIAAAAVIVQEDHQGKNRILAYLERNGVCNLTVTDLRSILKECLPLYMIPSLLFFIDHLPIAPNGKLDRVRLAALHASRPELDTPLAMPETETEQLLCRLLSDILRIEPIGSKDNLFELGADSITIFQLAGRIQSALQVAINPAFIFASPVVEELARRLDQRRNSLTA